MMREDKLIELFQFYANDIDGVRPERFPEDLYKQQFHGGVPRTHTLRHVAWMANEAAGFLKEARAAEDMPSTSAAQSVERLMFFHSRREKAMRWLGFIQGVLWTMGIFTLDELKEQSRKCSDEPEKAETK